MATRIQLCGRLTAELDGRRIEADLPGRQGRLLFVYLVLNRARPVGRGELAAALWPEDAPAGAEAGLSPLLSKLRRVVAVEGRSELRLELPADTWIDLEAATEALHRAEAAAARAEWKEVWGPGRVAQHVAAGASCPARTPPGSKRRGGASRSCICARSSSSAARASRSAGPSSIPPSAARAR